MSTTIRVVIIFLLLLFPLPLCLYSSVIPLSHIFLSVGRIGVVLFASGLIRYPVVLSKSGSDPVRDGIVDFTLLCAIADCLDELVRFPSSPSSLNYPHSTRAGFHNPSSFHGPHLTSRP